MNIQNTQTMMLTLDAFIYIHLSNMNIHVVQQQKDQTVQNKTNKQKKSTVSTRDLYAIHVAQYVSTEIYLYNIALSLPENCTT